MAEFPEIATPRPSKEWSNERSPSLHAADAVRGERQSDYGHPLDNMRRIARLWTVRLEDKLLPDSVIEPHEVAALMRLMKEARLMETPDHIDSFVDIAGYVDVEWEVHREEERRAAKRLVDRMSGD